MIDLKNQLRIGNNVLLSMHDQHLVYTVQSLTKSKCGIQRLQGGELMHSHDYIFICGIPLDSKILKTCGFKHEINKQNELVTCNPDHYQIFEYHNWNNPKLPVIIKDVRGEYFLDGFLGTQLHYLHELQNIYQDITKQVLTYAP